MNKHFYSFISITSSILLAFLAGSCDKFEDDLDASLNNQEEFFAENDVALLQKGHAATVVNLLENDQIGTDVQFSIKQYPLFGEISILPEGLMLYKLKNTFLSHMTTDEITYTICNDGNCDDATVTIQFATNTASLQFDCINFGVIDDYHLTNNDFLSVNVLANDVLCSSSVDPNSLRIVWQEESNSTISVTDGKIDFVSGTETEDRSVALVYEASLLSDPEQKIQAPAIFRIHTQPEENCISDRINLQKDQAFADATFGANPITIDVLQNDEYCGWKIDWPNFTINQYPSLGTAFIQNRKIIYIPYEDSKGEDEFSYEICQNGDCGTTTVSVSVQSSPALTCLSSPVLLQNDEFRTVNEFNEFTYYHAILANDSFCSQQIIWSSLTIGQEPLFGVAEITEGNLLRYIPNPDYEGIDSLSYQLCTEDSCYSASVAMNVSLENCKVIALDDHFSFEYTDATTTPLLLNVLENDLICDSDFYLELQTPEQFESGFVSIIENQLLFIPNQPESIDNEIIINYQLCNANGQCDVASVNVEIPQTCEVLINSDVYDYSNQDYQEVVLYPLENDLLCNFSTEDIKFRVISGPEEGDWNATEAGVIYWVSTDSIPDILFFEYEVCTSAENCQSAKIEVWFTDEGDGRSDIVPIKATSRTSRN